MPKILEKALHDSPLRAVLKDAARDNLRSMDEFTVLAEDNDPYRLDTEANHRVAAWFAEQLRNRRGDRQTHLRGFHYALVADGKVEKPNGEVYKNTQEDWKWLQEEAAKAARWLGYTPFEQIIDERNAAPIIHRGPWPEHTATLYYGLVFERPDGLSPVPALIDFEGRQTHGLVFYGEKSSLSEVLVPLAEKYAADVYLPIGEISDTRLFQIAADAAEDGRPLVVFTVTDCDPSGRQMPVSIARKLQALRDLRFNDLEFKVVPVALTPEQAKELGLPSTPLKEKEKRADRWKAAFGIEQTEIDAMLSTEERIKLLTRMVEDAVAPYFDATLKERVAEARAAWMEQARALVAERIDAEELADIEADAEDLADKAEALDERLAALADSVGELPEAVAPPTRVTSAQWMAQGDGAIADTDWDWDIVTLGLKAHKAYGGDDD